MHVRPARRVRQSRMCRSRYVAFTMTAFSFSLSEKSCFLARLFSKRGEANHAGPRAKA